MHNGVAAVGGKAQRFRWATCKGWDRWRVTGKRRRWRRGPQGGEDIYLAVSNRAIKLSHCGSSVGRGLVGRPRGQAYQERDATTVSSTERAKERNIERGWSTKTRGKGWVATRESSLTIAACFRRILSNGIPWNSLTILLLSLSLSFSPTPLFPSPSPSFSTSKHSLRKAASFLSSVPVALPFLQSPLHSSPFEPPLDSQILQFQPCRHYGTSTTKW